MYSLKLKLFSEVGIGIFFDQKRKLSQYIVNLSLKKALHFLHSKAKQLHHISILAQNQPTKVLSRKYKGSVIERN